MDFSPLVQAIIAGKQVAPQSWGAYAALVFSSISCALLLYDRVSGKGKSLQKMDDKIDRLCDQVADIEETQRVMDGHLASLSTNVRDMTNEWKGHDGQNGWKSIVRQLLVDVKSIQERNTRIDAIADYEREQRRKVGRSPERARDHLEGNDT